MRKYFKSLSSARDIVSIVRISIRIALILSLTFPVLISPAGAVENVEKTKLMVSTWNLSKSKGESDLSAAQSVVATLLIIESESKYEAFKKKTAPKAKKIVTIWLKSKQSKLPDAIAAKNSGFTSSTAKSGDIYFLKKGVSAWQAAKKAKRTDSEASLAFTRSVWEATLSYAAILMTSEATVEKMRKEIEILNSSNES